MNSEIEDENSCLEVEVETLKSIYIHELEVLYNKSGIPECVSVHLYPATADNLQKQYVRLLLNLKLPEQYPNELPEIFIRNPRGLSDEEIESIMNDLQTKANERKGGPMLYELIEVAKEHLTIGNTPSCQCAICLYDFTASDVFTKTECYHYFHSYCLAQYIKYMVNKAKEMENPANVFETSDVTQVDCPICRHPISSLNLLNEQYSVPYEVEEASDLSISPEVKELQQKMSELYLKQKEQGGIIDIEAERNRYLLEIAANVPTDANNSLEEQAYHDFCNQEENSSELVTCENLSESSELNKVTEAVKNKQSQSSSTLLAEELENKMSSETSEMPNQNKSYSKNNHKEFTVDSQFIDESLKEGNELSSSHRKYQNSKGYRRQNFKGKQFKRTEFNDNKPSEDQNESVGYWKSRNKQKYLNSKGKESSRSSEDVSESKPLNETSGTQHETMPFVKEHEISRDNRRHSHYKNKHSRRNYGYFPKYQNKRDTVEEEHHSAVVSENEKMTERNLDSHQEHRKDSDPKTNKSETDKFSSFNKHQKFKSNKSKFNYKDKPNVTDNQNPYGNSDRERNHSYSLCEISDLGDNYKYTRGNQRRNQNSRFSKQSSSEMHIPEDSSKETAEIQGRDILDSNGRRFSSFKREPRSKQERPPRFNRNDSRNSCNENYTTSDQNSTESTRQFKSRGNYSNVSVDKNTKDDKSPGRSKPFWKRERRPDASKHRESMQNTSGSNTYHSRTFQRSDIRKKNYYRYDSTKDSNSSKSVKSQEMSKTDFVSESNNANPVSSTMKFQEMEHAGENCKNITSPPPGFSTLQFQNEFSSTVVRPPPGFLAHS